MTIRSVFSALASTICEAYTRHLGQSNRPRSSENRRLHKASRSSTRPATSALPTARFGTESQATQGFAVNGFASTPYTIAVGGTDFDALSASFASYVNNTNRGAPPYYATALKYIPENPWNNSTTVNTTLFEQRRV